MLVQWWAILIDNGHHPSNTWSCRMGLFPCAALRFPRNLKIIQILRTSSPPWPRIRASSSGTKCVRMAGQLKSCRPGIDPTLPIAFRAFRLQLDPWPSRMPICPPRRLRLEAHTRTFLVNGRIPSQWQWRLGSQSLCDWISVASCRASVCDAGIALRQHWSSRPDWVSGPRKSLHTAHLFWLCLVCYSDKSGTDRAEENPFSKSVLHCVIPVHLDTTLCSGESTENWSFIRRSPHFYPHIWGVHIVRPACSCWNYRLSH